MPTPHHSDADRTGEFTGQPSSPGTELPTQPNGTGSMLTAEVPAAATLLGGRYELQQEIARGGMGVVLRCRDHALHRDLAIKILHTALRERPESVRRFREEAQITGQLQHPGIVPIHEQGNLPDGRPFFVMKLVKGHTLSELLRPRSEDRQVRTRLLPIFLQVCQAMAYAHSKDVLHRDLKPANVMVGAFGEVQVMDWGLAKVLGRPTSEAEDSDGSVLETPRGEDHPGTQVGSVLGTYAYMPPEQARGEVSRMDRRSDVFGLGAILCEILTDQPPFTGSPDQLRESARLGRIEPALARLNSCGADAELVHLARSCLQPRLEDRPSDAATVAQAVTEYLAKVEARLREAEREQAAAQARAEEASVTARAERRARHLTVGLSLALVLLVAAGGTITWAVLQQQASAAARRQADDEKTQASLDLAREKMQTGWEASDAALLDQALADAAHAVELATTASPDQQQQSTLLHQQIARARQQAADNRRLVAALMDVAAPPETQKYRQRKGTLRAIAPLRIDQQFALAFQNWGIDLDHSLTAEQIARLEALPRPVLDEVVSALSEWAMERRRQRRPEEEWRRLHELANRLDDNADRQEFRALLIQDEPGLGKARLVELASQVDPQKEPVLGLVMLGRALERSGSSQHAVDLLRAALAVRPNEAVLLGALARTLELRHPNSAEVIECYQAARALRPDLGIALSHTLMRAGREAQAEAVLRDLTRRQPSNPETHFHLGKALYVQNKLDEAEQLYRKVLDMRPDFPEALNNLGIVLQDRKQLDDAVAAYRKSIVLRPADHATHYNLASALREQNKLDDAVAAYQKAIKLAPDFAPAHNNLGTVHILQERYDDAIAAFTRAANLAPDYAETHNNLGLTLQMQKRHSEAVAAFKKAIAARPDYADAYNNLGVSLHHQNRLDEAVAAYHRATELQPENADAYTNLATTYFAQKKLDEAVQAYHQAIERKPDSPEAFNNLGIVLHEQKEFTKAVASFNKALALRAEYPDACYNLGLALADQKKYAEAATVFGKAIKLAPTNAQAHYRLGIVLHTLKKPTEAIAAYRRATELKSDYAEAFSKLGIVLSEQKRFEESAAASRTVIKLRPDDPAGHTNLGMALVGLQQWDDAATEFRKALALRPEDYASHINLGMVLLTQKRGDEAMPLFRKAIELQPENAAGHFNLGLALRSARKLDDALTAFRKAVRLVPNQPMFQATLRATERWSELEKKLPAILAGQQLVVNAREQIELGEFCLIYKQHYRTASRFYADAMEATPALVRNPTNGVRYNAACAAALAAAGKGEDAMNLGDEEIARLRQQALTWLRADLALWEQVADTPASPLRADVDRQLRHWLADPDLAGVREKDTLTKLPEAERIAWEELWADVEALRKKATEQMK